MRARAKYLGRHERAPVVDLMHQIILLHRRVKRLGCTDGTCIINNCTPSRKASAYMDHTADMRQHSKLVAKKLLTNV